MSRRFLNPYHFVPADDVPANFRAEPDGVDAETFFDEANIAADLGTRSHDRYCEDGFSGRIVCRLTTTTPLIVGGERHGETDEDHKLTDYTRIEPYRFAGRLALPATSLKGMLSTIAEAASFSALRVLNDVHPIVRRRRGCRALFLKDFFPADRLPMHAGRTGRITPAEWLFGFVREDRRAGSVRAGHAGRVRLSNAWLDLSASGAASEDALSYCPEADWNEIDPSLKGDELDAARRRQADLVAYVRLRELSSPNPPSPQLYFRARCGADEPIAKHQLNRSGHKPQGIKLYVHHHVADGDAPDRAILDAARTRPKIGAKDERTSAKRKLAVKPVRSGAVFWFHLDFENLSRAELELLCFALKPSQTFHHRLGLAKPLGLGTIEIDPVAFFQIDRVARYERQDLFGSPRYCAAHGAPEVIAGLPDCYAAERKVTVTAQSDLAVSRLAGDYRDCLEQTEAGKEVWSALSTLGTFPRAPEDDGSWLAVHTPLAVGQNAGDVTGEKETFKWFSNNASHLASNGPARDPQFLRPIRADGRLPALRKNRPYKPSR